MIKELLVQMKWQFLILHRNNLINISVAMTVIYGLVFFMVKDLGYTDKVLTVLLYNDPALIGLFFVGLAVLMEKKQSVLSAIFVSPANLHVYLLARVLCLSIVGWACGLAMAFWALGFSFSIVPFSIGVFSVTMLFSLLGICLLSFTSEFLMYIMQSIPLLIFMSLPLFNYLGVTSVGWFDYLPVQATLNLIRTAYEGGALGWGADSLLIVIWISLFYALAYSLFKTRLIRQGI